MSFAKSLNDHKRYINLTFLKILLKLFYKITKIYYI